MSLEQLPQLESRNTSSDNAQNQTKLLVMGTKKQVKTWQLAIAAILLLGAGFALGQKLQRFAFK